MSVELKYRVLPHEPEYKVAPLTEVEKDKVRGLEKESRFVIWVGIVGGVVVAFALMTMQSNELDQVGPIVGGIVGIAIATVATARISSSMKNKNILSLEQKRCEQAKAAYESEVRRCNSEATSLTARVMQTYESSTKLTSELHQHLDEGSQWLKHATTEYHSKAFAPFWDAVENAAQHLSAFNDKANRLSQNADEYYKKLKDRKHTFPAFPVQNGTIPDASSVARDFRRVVRMGQTDFQFANIWEHRRTREVLIAGFRTLGEAVNNLGVTIENTLLNLQGSVSSDLAKVIEGEIRTRESLDHRMVEQNRMLDNLQQHRKPDITDKPSRY